MYIRGAGVYPSAASIGHIISSYRRVCALSPCAPRLPGVQAQIHAKQKINVRSPFCGSPRWRSARGGGQTLRQTLYTHTHIPQNLATEGAQINYSSLARMPGTFPSLMNWSIMRFARFCAASRHSGASHCSPAPESARIAADFDRRQAALPSNCGCLSFSTPGEGVHRVTDFYQLPRGRQWGVGWQAL